MLVNVNELVGPGLDWAVGVAQGDKVFRLRVARPSPWDKENPSDKRWEPRAQVPKVGLFADYSYNPSRNWMLGGPIIDEFGISTARVYGGWLATSDHSVDGFLAPTLLVAAMRCYVFNALGEAVEVPNELMEEFHDLPSI